MENQSNSSASSDQSRGLTAARGESSKDVCATGFPFRRTYISDSEAREMLAAIMSAPPAVRDGEFKLPRGKVVSRLKGGLPYALSRTIAGTACDEHWLVDRVVDVFTEDARAAAVGYGERFSPIEFWEQPRLRGRWLRPLEARLRGRDPTREELREAIYDAVQESRPAYASVTKSLYAELFSRLEGPARVLDVVAYGERLIAAYALGATVYHGVDPNELLRPGLIRLLDELRTVAPAEPLAEGGARFFFEALEDYRPPRRGAYNLVTLSPPPFVTETYGGGARQSAVRYRTFPAWFRGFLVEVVCLAREEFLEAGGVFAFTALDRDGKRAAPKSVRANAPGWQVARALDIEYVEPLLLACSGAGMAYTGTVALSSGGKAPNVPWWTFSSGAPDSAAVALALDRLQHAYPELLAGTTLPRLFAASGVPGPSPRAPPTEGFALEAARLELMRRGEAAVAAAAKTTHHAGLQRAHSALGRWVMNHMATSPDDFTLDPLFPTGRLNAREENAVFVDNVGVDPESVVFELETGSGRLYEVRGVRAFFAAAARLVAHLATHAEGDAAYCFDVSRARVSVSRRGETVFSERTSVARGLDALYGPASSTAERRRATAALTMRYAALGARGHLFTRPQRRIELTKTFFGTSRAVDVFASFSNNNTPDEGFYSPFPDLERVFGSRGSAFDLAQRGAPLEDGVLYLANPVDSTPFVMHAVADVIVPAALRGAEVYFSVGFTVWRDEAPDFESQLAGSQAAGAVAASGNAGLSALFSAASKNDMLLAVYVLDSARFPSVDPADRDAPSRGARDSAISVAVLLASPAAARRLRARPPAGADASLAALSGCVFRAA